ncbi:hypothetical protein SNE40_011162 [Patella caerulea]|uniref:XK-related protein n=1 Tax=Patella caerulea TaxID=87958 RepID=A0AAN8PTL5_PATCE
MSIKTKVPLSRRCNKNWHEFLHFTSPINSEGGSRNGIFRNRQKADDAFSNIELESEPFELQSVKNDDVDLSASDRTETRPTCQSTRKYNRPISATDKVDVAFGKGEEKVQSVSDYYDSFEYDFNYFFLFLGIVSVIIFILDIISDVYLAFKYFEDGHFIFGLTTTFLTAGPSFVMCCFGVHWYILDYKSEKIIIQEHQNSRNCEPAHQATRCLWILRFLCTILQIGPLIRTVEYLYYGCMSMNQKLSREEKIRYHRWMLYEDLDACLLRLFESFLESAPQLIFQLYAWATLKPSEDVVSLSIRITALLMSWASLSISLVSYHKSLRYSRKEKKNLSLLATPVYFIWRACEVGARLLCLSFFVIAFQAWIFLPVLLHWVAVTIWIFKQNTNFYDNRCFETIFNIICGYVMIFCFLNLREGHTRFRYLWFYIVFYFENFFMLGIWWQAIPLGDWYDFYGFILIFVLSVLHIIVQLIYYKFSHPSKIDICLPWNRNLCYESVCHSLDEDERQIKKQHHLDKQVVVNNV